MSPALKSVVSDETTDNRTMEHLLQLLEEASKTARDMGDPVLAQLISQAFAETLERYCETQRALLVTRLVNTRK